MSRIIKTASWGFICLAAMIVVNSLISFYHLSRMRQIDLQLGHTNQTLLALKETLSLVKDVETGGRGFVLTGDRAYLAPHVEAIERLDNELAQLEARTRTFPEQDEAVQALKKLVLETIAFVRQAVAMRDEVGAEAATTLISRAAGKHQMDRIRQLAAQIETAEGERQRRWEEYSQDSFETALATFIVATVSAVALMAVVFILIRRELLAGHRHAARLTASEARFRRLVDANVVGVLVADFDGRIVEANDAFLSLVGYTREELTGGQLNWKDMTPAEFRECDELAIEEIKTRGACAPFEKQLLHKEGSRVPILLGCAKLDEPSDQCICYAIDLSERKKLEEQLRQYVKHSHNQRSWLEAVMNLLPMPMLLVETDHSSVVFANRAAEELAGGLFPLLSDHECASENYGTDLGGNRIPLDQMPLARVARGETLSGYQMRWHLPDGPKSLLINADSLPAMYGHESVSAVLFQDITRLKQIEAELRRANRSKDALLAMLGHELRNPLAAITSSAELLRLQPPGDPMYEQAQEILERHIQHLSSLIDDMLDLSRLSSGKLRLNAQTLDLAEVLENALQTVRPQMLARRHRLNVQLASQPAYVCGDRPRLEQVFVNLLLNAAKYTDPEGQIDVCLERDDQQVVARVRDNGIGIAPNLLPQVFEMFAQLNPSIDRAEGGLGIGLSVVKTLVELHGGQIEAHSAGPGQGAEFVVRLPTVAAPEPQESPPVKPNGKTSCQSSRVLVVEDNPDIARVMAALIKRCGHEPSVAHDGPSALDLAHRIHPDVALLDIGLPGMSGHDLARRLRDDAELHGMRLVALTGYGQEEDRRRSREAGFDQHLTKPVSLAKLQDVLDGAEVG